MLPQPTGSGRGLILRRWPAGETSVVAAALVEGHGLLRLLAKGARQMRSRLRPLVEPGRLVDLEFTLYRDRDLQFLRGGGLVLDPLVATPTLERTAFLLAALEIVDRCRSGDGHETGLFELCETYVQVLSCADAGCEAGFFYAFEIALLALLGMRPQIEICTRCGLGCAGLANGGHWLSAAAGGLVCGACAAGCSLAGARPLSAAHLDMWAQLAGAPGRWPDGALPRDMARDWGIMLHGFLGYHLPGYRLPAALQLLRGKQEARVGPRAEERA